MQASMKVYCEHSALTGEIRKWAREGRIELVHFPYDPNSRTGKIRRVAEPSSAQIRDLSNFTMGELPGTISDYTGSEHFEKILAIVGPENRRDALHVDSAFKSRCAAFITTDSDILNHKGQLLSLLGMHLFDPRSDLNDLELLIAKSR